tara:strand:+ start:2153 stop:2788 length:636 start_codon:yes stop_codon:yes gene_type:complete
MINNSGGALLSEVYGTENIKVKKKDKKKKEVRYLPENNQHIQPDQLQKIDNFDDSFHQKSNVMPFGTTHDNNYYTINEENTDMGPYFPFETHTLEGQKKTNPPPKTAPKSNTILSDENSVPPTKRVEHKQPHPWDKGIKISEEDFRELQEYKLFKEQQQKAIVNQQIEKSQSSEGFSNVNDDFNDVLLFGLLGIFFLIFTDYVYKLGRKSY